MDFQQRKSSGDKIKIENILKKNSESPNDSEEIKQSFPLEEGERESIWVTKGKETLPAPAQFKRVLGVYSRTKLGNGRLRGFYQSGFGFGKRSGSQKGINLSQKKQFQTDGFMGLLKQDEMLDASQTTKTKNTFEVLDRAGTSFKESQLLTEKKTRSLKKLVPVKRTNDSKADALESSPVLHKEDQDDPSKKTAPLKTRGRQESFSNPCSFVQHSPVKIPLKHSLVQKDLVKLLQNGIGLNEKLKEVHQRNQRSIGLASLNTKEQGTPSKKEERSPEKRLKSNGLIVKISSIGSENNLEDSPKRTSKKALPVPVSSFLREEKEKKVIPLNLTHTAPLNQKVFLPSVVPFPKKTQIPPKNISMKTSLKFLGLKSKENPKKFNFLPQDFEIFDKFKEMNIEQSLDDFIFGRIIGKGSYAVVRTASHKESGMKVAVKTYEKHKLYDELRRKNVRREAEILFRLDHPNIIKILALINGETQVHLVMEHAKKESLYSFLKNQPKKLFDEEKARKIFKQIMSAMAYCHQNYVVHRDIKLDNLLIDSDGNIKLIDFGFSILADPDQKLTLFCGTPSYMSPEIVLKRDYCGPPADTWACGVLLFKLLSGHYPFNGPDNKSLYRSICRCDPNFPHFFSDSAKGLLRQIFQFDPVKRASSFQILEHHWFRDSSL